MSAEPVADVEHQAPLFSVAGGNPSDEEVAALAAVLAVLRRGRGRPHAPELAHIAGGWNSYWHVLRRDYLPGQGAWRSTFRR